MPRKTIRRRVRPLRLLAAAALVLVVFLYYRPLRSYLHTRQDVAQRLHEVRSLAAEKRSLEQRLRTVDSGSTLVREARRLGLVKPGERLYIVKGIAEWRRRVATIGGRG
jgi:cell division protein FtsB